jgi:hypothetical protein
MRAMYRGFAVVIGLASRAQLLARQTSFSSHLSIHPAAVFSVHRTGLPPIQEAHLTRLLQRKTRIPASLDTASRLPGRRMTVACTASGSAARLVGAWNGSGNACGLRAAFGVGSQARSHPSLPHHPLPRLSTEANPEADASSRRRSDSAMA